MNSFGSHAAAAERKKGAETMLDTLLTQRRELCCSNALLLIFGLRFRALASLVVGCLTALAIDRFLEATTRAGSTA